MNEVTLLSREQIFGDNKLDIFKKIGRSATLTDFAILLGGAYNTRTYSLIRPGYYWIKPNSEYNIIDERGCKNYDYLQHRATGIRPVVSYSKIKNGISNEKINEDGVKEIEYGEYPQYAVNGKLQYKLENLYKNDILTKTDKTYTTDSRKYYEDYKDFLPQEHIEYKFDGKKYVRVKANSWYTGNLFSLSNGVICSYDYVWVEVSKVKWLVDKKNDIALSKDILVAGIQFDNKEEYDGDFENTNMYKFLNTYFIKDIQIKDSEMDLSKVPVTYEEAMTLIEEAKRKYNEILDKSIIDKTFIKKL